MFIFSFGQFKVVTLLINGLRQITLNWITNVSELYTFFKSELRQWNFPKLCNVMIIDGEYEIRLVCFGWAMCRYCFIWKSVPFSSSSLVFWGIARSVSFSLFSLFYPPSILTSSSFQGHQARQYSAGYERPHPPGWLWLLPQTHGGWDGRFLPHCCRCLVWAKANIPELFWPPCQPPGVSQEQSAVQLLGWACSLWFRPFS